MFTAPACTSDVAIKSLIRRCLFGAALAALVFIGSPSVFAIVVTDDFSDLDDTANPTWTHLDGYVGSTGQTWDASTGVYRLAAPSNGVETFGFVGSHVGPSFTDVRVSMDLVEFYTTFAPPNGPEFVSIMARANGNNEVGGLNGYAYGYDPIANANGGEIVLYQVNTGVDIQDMGAQRVHLDEAKDYRFVLELVGNVIHGQVFNLTDGGALIAESFANIANETPVYASGTSGVFGYTQNPFSTLFGIDNFRAETIVAGDYNDDGSTDAADYVVWRKTVGQQSPQLDPVTFEVTGLGNMMANGAVSGACGFNTPNCEVIDDADYGVWSTHFGASVAGGGGSVSAVPEPGSGTLMLLGLISVSLLRRRAAR